MSSAAAQRPNGLKLKTQRKRSQKRTTEFTSAVQKKLCPRFVLRGNVSNSGNPEPSKSLSSSNDDCVDLKYETKILSDISPRCSSCHLQFPGHADLSQHQTTCGASRMPSTSGEAMRTLTSSQEPANKKSCREVNLQERCFDSGGEESEDGKLHLNNKIKQEIDVAEANAHDLNTVELNNERGLQKQDKDTNCEKNGISTTEKKSSGSNEKWGLCNGFQQCFHCTAREKVFLLGERTEMRPADMYLAFMTDEIIDFLVEYINLNAENTLNSSAKHPDFVNSWQPTNREEVKVYIGLRIWMGLVKLPRFSDYWSEGIFQNGGIARKAMTKDRFLLILRFWHSRNCPEQGNARPIHPILEKLEQRFMEVKTPGEFLVLDEYEAPVHTDRIFNQYMPFRKEQHGKKSLRLCDSSGYTYRMVVFSGRLLVEPTNPRMASHIIMNLVEPYLDCGRTLCSDNIHTSMELIQSLLGRKTHFLGSIHKNNPDFPEEVLGAYVRKGQIVGMEDKLNGVTVIKWGDEEDVQMVSTKHSICLSSVGRRSRVGKEEMKPTIVLEYDKMKGALDKGDLLSSYSCIHADSVPWLHRVVDDTVFYTCLVNALLVWNETRGESSRRMSLLPFCREVCLQLLNMPRDPERMSTPSTHYLLKGEEIEGDKTQRKARWDCQGCYKYEMKSMRPKQAVSKVKRVNTQCITCPDKPYLCLPCFKNLHESV